MSQRAGPVVFVLLGLLTNGGCTDRGGGGFHSSRPEFMREVKAALTKSGVSFEEGKDGTIRYQGKHRDVVNRIRDEVEKEISGGLAVKYKDKESREYLIGLLSSRGMKYRVETREDGEWIRWYPESETQAEEIGMQVVQHNFDLQHEKARLRCMQEKSPSNKSLNKGAAQKARRAC